MTVSQSGNMLSVQSAVYGSLSGSVDTTGNVDIRGGSIHCSGTYNPSQASLTIVCVDNVRTCFITLTAAAPTGFGNLFSDYD